MSRAISPNIAAAIWLRPAALRTRNE